MSALQELLDSQTTDISQSSTSNLSSAERIRYMDRSRKAIADKYDWPFFNKNAELAVTLQGTDELWATAPLPTDIKSYRLRSLRDVPAQLDFAVLEENEFKASYGRCCTIGRESETDEIQIKGVIGAEADADAFLAAQATSSVATTVVTDFLTSPDVPRRIIITPGGTTADVAAGNVVVVGTDMNGSVLSENIALTANQTAVSTSTGFFKTITSITFPIMDGNGATFDVGTNSVVGLKIEYIRKLTPYTPDTPDLSQISEFPDEMDEVIVLGSVYRILMKFNRDSAMIAQYKTEYAEALAAAWEAYQGRIKGATHKIVNIRQARFRPVAANRYR